MGYSITTTNGTKYIVIFGETTASATIIIEPMESLKEKPDFEYDFRDPIFIKELDKAYEPLRRVAADYARVNYYSPVHGHSESVARYSFIRGFNFANHSLQKDGKYNDQKICANKASTEALHELMKAREEIERLKQELKNK